MDTRDWIQRARQGDQEAFASLLKAFGPAVYRLALRVTGNPADAEDAAQEAFLRAFRALDRFDCARPFGPWILKIALRRAMTKTAKRRRDVSLENCPQAQVAAEAPRREESTEEDLERVRTAIKNLEPGDRAILALKYDSGLSLEEIASALDIRAGAVKVRLFRARQRLMRRMEESQDEL